MTNDTAMADAALTGEFTPMSAPWNGPSKSRTASSRPATASVEKNNTNESLRIAAAAPLLSVLNSAYTVQTLHHLLINCEKPPHSRMLEFEGSPRMDFLKGLNPQQ